MTSQPAVPDDDRLCEHCLLRKPLVEFRLRYRGRPIRLNQCRDCHNGAERFRRAAGRERRGRREVAKSLTALKNERSDRQLKAICGEMAVRFGGVAGIVDAWHRSLDKDLAAGGYPAFRQLAAILRLTQYCERNRPNYGAMSDEELEGAILSLGGFLPDSDR